MKATELRIGNYVWDDYSGKMIVSAILESSAVYLRKTIKLPSGEYLIQNIEPIPLTEEWLLKFGLKIIDNDYEGGYDFTEYKGRLWENIILQTEDKFYYFIHIDQDNFYSHTMIEIKYVHQLQNLYFALTNEELTIKDYD